MMHAGSACKVRYIPEYPRDHPSALFSGQKEGREENLEDNTAVASEGGGYSHISHSPSARQPARQPKGQRTRAGLNGVELGRHFCEFVGFENET